MIGDAAALALSAIRRNALRAGLTVLGIVIGVAAVITMITLGRGATRAVSNQITSLGSNLVIAQPGQRIGPGREAAGAPNFTLRDWEAVARQINHVAAVAPVAGRKITVVAGARNWSTTVTGSTPAYLVAGNWTLAAGREFFDNELLAGAAVCIVGSTVQRELFAGRSALGSEIRIKNFACEVIGELKSKGQSAMGMDQDDLILMPLRTAQRRLTGNNDINALLVAATGADKVASVKSQLNALLLERRKIEAGEELNFTVLDTRQISETLSGTTQILTLLLGAVAAVSLVVGGIGIMNIMLVSVTERTREIGVRLAIGALERDVLLQFLTEAVILAGFGGAAGVLVALVASVALANAVGVPFVFDLQINVIAFAVSAGIGMVFGYLPARRAASMNPIEALRHD
jgi:putative ABC transport system permease protein